jgi:hypothetical protein
VHALTSWKNDLAISLDLTLDPGTWQVYSHGAIGASTVGTVGFGVNVLFGLLPESKGSQILQQKFERRFISMEHGSTLPIGRCIDGQTNRLLEVRPRSPSFKCATHAIDLSKEKTSLVLRSLVGSQLPGVWNEGEFEAYLVHVTPDEKGWEYFIPCHTLFHHYWCGTTRLLRLVTDGSLGDLRTNVCEPHWIDQAGTMFVRPTKQFKHDELRILAAVIAEPAALVASHRISTDLVTQFNAAERKSTYHPFAVLPPFAMRLTFTGIYTQFCPGDGRKARYLSHILSSDLEPAFKNLVVLKTRGAPNTGGARVQTTPWPALSEFDEDDNVDLIEEPPGSGLEVTQIKATPSIGDRFPSLALTPVETKLEQADEAGVNEDTIPMHVDPADGPRSAIGGSAGNQSSVIAAELTFSSHDQLDCDDNLIGADGTVREATGDLAKFAELLATPPPRVTVDAREWAVSTLYLSPYSSSPAEHAPMFFRVPRLINGDPLPWLFTDFRLGARRLGVCIQIELKALDDGTIRRRWLLDFEYHKPALNVGHIRRARFLAAWFDDSPTVEDMRKRLRQLIRLIARKGNTTIFDSISPDTCVCGLNHISGEAARIVERAFNATNKATTSGSLNAAAPHPIES